MRKYLLTAALAAGLALPALLVAQLPAGPFAGPDIWTDPVPAEYRIKAAGTELCVRREAGAIGTQVPHMVLRACTMPIGMQSVTLSPNGITAEPLDRTSPVTWRMTTPVNSNCLTAARGVIFGAPAVDELACTPGATPSRSGGPDQTWRLRRRGAFNTFEIRTADGRCWTAQGGQPRDGVQVVLERCSDLSGGQQWLIADPQSFGSDPGNDAAAREFGWLPIPGVNSGSPGQFRSLRHLNLPSGDYTSGIATANDEGMECARLCIADSQCLAYTWVDPRARGGQAMCYKKNAYSTVVADNFTNSGIVRPR